MGIKYTEEERMEIAAERGIIVDPEDQWILGAYTWCMWGGYVGTNLPVSMQPPMYALLHHCLVGQPLYAMEVDHINRNTRDNRRSNLRYFTRSQNQLNTEQSDTASYIYPAERVGAYLVKMKRNKIYHYLGTFESLEAAEEARDQWLSAHET